MRIQETSAPHSVTAVPAFRSNSAIVPKVAKAAGLKPNWTVTDSPSTRSVGPVLDVGFVSYFSGWINRSNAVVAAKSCPPRTNIRTLYEFESWTKHSLAETILNDDIFNFFHLDTRGRLLDIPIDVCGKS